MNESHVPERIQKLFDCAVVTTASAVLMLAEREDDGTIYDHVELKLWLQSSTYFVIVGKTVT